MCGKPCSPGIAEPMNLFLVLLCFHAQLLLYLLSCFCLKPQVFSLFPAGEEWASSNGTELLLGLNHNTSLNCIPQISFCAAAFQHTRTESWAARGNSVLPLVLKSSFTTYPVYRADCYFLLSANCHRLWWSIYIFKTTPKMHCEIVAWGFWGQKWSIIWHILYFSAQPNYITVSHFKKITTVHREKKGKELYGETLIFKSNIKGNGNQPVDF